MTKPAPFTEAAIRRAMKAATKLGYRIGGVKPDGTVLVYDGDARPENLSIVPNHEQNEGANSWEDR